MKMKKKMKKEEKENYCGGEMVVVGAAATRWPEPTSTFT